MVRDEVGTVLKLADKLDERVVGQKHALEAIAQRIRTARADLADPRRPQGVFLLVGPSGVGKTETAMALADLLYGGDRNMVIVNMSEYKESHKVSRLVGTSKGYVGYGEGGVLTNAVKNRPYSRRAARRGREGPRERAGNLLPGVRQGRAAERRRRGRELQEHDHPAHLERRHRHHHEGVRRPGHRARRRKAWPRCCKADLLKAFKPALLGRMTVVPYYPLGDAVLKKIIELKLKQIGDRLQAELQGDVHVLAGGGGHGRGAVQGRGQRCPQRGPHHHRHGADGRSRPRC